MSSDETLAFIWGWTNSQITPCGFCNYTINRFKFETKLKFDVLGTMAVKLPRRVIHFQELKILYFREFIREQYGSGDNLVRNNTFKGILGCYNQIIHEPLMQAIADDYPELGKYKRPSGEPVKVQVKVVVPHIPVIEIPDPMEPVVNRVAQLGKARAHSEDEVVEFALKSKLTATDGEWFWLKCEGSGWTNGGKPIRDWRATLRAWGVAGYLPSKKNPGKESTNGDDSPQLPLI